MKKKFNSQSAFFNVRVLVAALFCVVGIFIALTGSGVFAQTKGPGTTPSPGAQDAPGTQTPDVVQMVGPVVLTTDLRDLPYIPPAPQIIKQLLVPYAPPKAGGQLPSETSRFPQFQSLLDQISRPVPIMPSPLLTFDGISAAQTGWIPPDTDGDVGPNHYVQVVNTSFRVFDKSGNPLSPVTTFNSFFAPLGGGTPCGDGNNQGDVFVLYDQLADRWVISDFAFHHDNSNPPKPIPPFYQCIGVSQTGDPLGG